MSVPLTLLDGASSQGYRVKRVDDIVVVTMQGAAFATTARISHAVTAVGADGELHMGNAHRDRAAYCEQHQTLLARNRGGLVLLT